MHNKSFTADNQATIIGGRNVGDKYFGATDGIMFADLDVIAVGPVVNCFNARSETTSAFHHSFVNPWLWGAIALSVVLQVAVAHVGLLNVAFGTVPLAPAQWAVCLAMGSTVLWFGELRKAVLRAWGR